MLVNAVSTKSLDSQAFGHRKREISKEELEAFASADDYTLRKFASVAASDAVNDKKHRRISNAIWASLPVSAGLSSMIGVAGRIPKIKAFAATTAAWAATFAVIDGVFGAKRYADRHSAGLREFNKEHPLLSTVATIGAAIGAIILGGKGASKLYEKYGAKGIEQLKKVGVDKWIKESKVLDKVSEYAAKVPSSIKGFAKGVIGWGPAILVMTSIAHTISHERARAVETFNQFEALKNEQAAVRDALRAEEA